MTGEEIQTELAELDKRWTFLLGRIADSDAAQRVEDVTARISDLEAEKDRRNVFKE